ncbi:MAG: T9SS type A sorting domain-containing protein [Bacteroidota bacterium]
MENFTKMLRIFLIAAMIFGIVPKSKSQDKTADIDSSGVIPAPCNYTPACSHIPLAAIFNNGPVYNSAGTGAGGANESIYYQGGTGTYASGCQYASGLYIADDFIVPTGKTWAVDSMDFFSYQTNSGNTSTITGIYLRIWSGKPGVAGSAILWGDMTTNRMASTTFTGIYRVLVLNGGTTRPIMKVVANTPNLSLAEGNYWVEWACSGSTSSGPWAPPVVTTENITGNAIQTVDGGINYADILYNTYAQGMPFVMYGDETFTSSVPDNPEKSTSAEFVVYPVVNDGQFNISITSPTWETFSIIISNNLGMMIPVNMKVAVNGTTERSLDLRKFPAGSYSVIFENNHKRMIRKILIIR